MGKQPAASSGGRAMSYSSRDRACLGCEKTFRSTGHARCKTCRGTRKDRACINCGRQYRGDQPICNRCRNVERSCIECGRAFRSVSNFVCGRCRTTERDCYGCGRTYRGHGRLCGTCLVRERDCVECSTTFVGGRALCNRCLYSPRICTRCGASFPSASNRICPACRTIERICSGCGRTFRAATNTVCLTCYFRSMPDGGTAAYRTYSNARRARVRAAEVTGPVPRETYTAIAASGPCVYCGDRASTVDHVRPLSRGGAEHPANLVPACQSCNSSKGSRLLTEWDAGRVTYAAKHCPKVAADLADLLTVELTS